jgi:hypothetical protein
MPKKGKQKEGLRRKHLETKGWDTKSEKVAKQHEQAYKDGKLDCKYLRFFTPERQLHYVRNRIAEKFHKPAPSQNVCLNCAYVVWQQDSGYITDEELLKYADGAFEPK